MKKELVGMLVAAACGGWLPAAHAQVAYTSKGVNLRAGPARDYPVVSILPSGASLAVQGCLPDYAWCDVMAGPYRGWVYAGNIAYAYEGQYVPVATYGSELGIAIVGFVLSDYWGQFYSNQPFFRDRDRWERHSPYIPQRHPARREPPALPGRGQPPTRVQPPARVQAPTHVQAPTRTQSPAHVQPRDREGARPLAPPAHDPGARGQGHPERQERGDTNH